MSKARLYPAPCTDTGSTISGYPFCNLSERDRVCWSQGEAPGTGSSNGEGRNCRRIADDSEDCVEDCRFEYGGERSMLVVTLLSVERDLVAVTLRGATAGDDMCRRRPARCVASVG